MLKGASASSSDENSDLNRIYEIFEESTVACNVCDGRRELIFVNQACARMWGYERNELIGRLSDELHHGDESEQLIIKQMHEKTANGAPLEFTVRNIHSTGEVYIAGVFMIPFVDGPSSKPYYIGITRELESESDSVTLHGPPEFRKMIADVLGIVGA